MTIGTELGVIEGFYGPLWSWEERKRLVTTLAPQGSGFYLYAPKADPYLRRRWTEPHPPEQARALKDFAETCQRHGVRFGVGLSPFEVFNDFNVAAKEALASKLAFLDTLGVEELAILFDDMRADTPDLAEQQADIIDWVRERTAASQLTMCPSFYSEDPVLDRVFGHRPDGYLRNLGERLDGAVRVFWTGEEVCAKEVSAGHLKRIAKLLQRKPLLWDNYPVNDGDRMSRHLHLRGFTGRPAANAKLLAGHAINPALQPTLTAIPAITLADSYRLGDNYEYGRAFQLAAQETLGGELAECVMQDLLLLQDAGLHRLSDERRDSLLEQYRAFDHPGAREIVRWLQGDYQVTDEQVQTQ